MFVIANKSYSLETIKLKCQEDLLLKVEDWENDIWSFLKIWFNDEIDYIEIKTSGSTGVPKIIKHQKKYMLASAEMTCSYFQLNKEHTALLCLSVISIGGMMMIIRSLVSGMNLIVIKPSSNPLKDIDKTVDFVAMVPFQAQNVFAENSEKWKLVRNVIVGGGTISEQLKTNIVKHQVNAFSTFGMTETISHFALNKIGVDSVYSVLDDVYIYSEKCLRVSAPKLGVKDLQTNDIVDLVNDKQFIWLGRKDNAIETGGVKVIPESVERKIEHLFYTRFFVSSIPDGMLNNKLVLVIEQSDADFDLEKLMPFLTKYERPKLVFSFKNFIETKNGKVNRKETMKLLSDKQ